MVLNDVLVFRVACCLANKMFSFSRLEKFPAPCSRNYILIPVASGYIYESGETGCERTVRRRFRLVRGISFDCVH